jgi:hypothetical protein
MDQRMAHGMARGTARHAKAERPTDHARVHRRAHAHADTDGNHVDLKPQLKSRTAMFTSAQPSVR